FIGKYTSEDSTVDLNALLAAYNAKNGVSDAQKKELSEVEHIKFLESFSSEPIRRSGDANNSGSVNMADAVTILCSCCNPDEYALTEWGEFNADVNNTGDGITPGDAAKIQRRLVGIEK
ncbi:MAG: dockerin type I repeat-containing protein, partial [Ruminococcus sp.]|nr:dockerin type I repeat-containing protein [Ruminococcus sp.]